MPTAKSFLEELSNLDNITFEEVIKEIKEVKNSTLFENELGNRLLYSTSVPVSSDEFQLDLAILRQAITFQPQKFYNSHSGKMFIPESLCIHFSNLNQLALVFIEAFNPLGVTSIYLQSERLGVKPLGTLIKPEAVLSGVVVKLKIDGKEYTFKAGQLRAIPALGSKIDFVFESTGTKLLGREKFSTEIAGGDVGIIVDLRIPT